MPIEASSGDLNFEITQTGNLKGFCERVVALQQYWELQFRLAFLRLVRVFSPAALVLAL
jgi:hypothetical protein